eukprot:scaffold1541_cov256-Pinguiococcus_pyrenoidosus.AAC.32
MARAGPMARMDRLAALCVLVLCFAAKGRALLAGTMQPVVVLPGFGNDAVDYINPLGKGEELGIVSAFKRRGTKRKDAKA